MATRRANAFAVDILKAKSQGWTPSAIATINNQDAEAYVNLWAKKFPYHDKDARYNRLFPNQAGLPYGEEVNQFVVSRIPDGASTIVTHKNGTTFTYPNYAIFQGRFPIISSGIQFFNTFCNKGSPSPGLKKRREEDGLERRADPTVTGYPAAITSHPEGVVGGYYLTGKGYEDVAVGISVHAFEELKQD